MSGAACKAAICAPSWNKKQSKREMHLREVAFHPAICRAIGDQHDSGTPEGLRLFKMWINALQPGPGPGALMTEQGMDDVERILALLTEV